jgi:GT2 family glycosyltransferase/glycosyltransferase involved in cell wall biosynthesis
MAWVSLQKERVGIFFRALLPRDKQAREVILSSFRRRLRMRRVRPDAKEDAAHEIDVGRYQEWIERFDELTPEDRAEIQEHIAKGVFAKPLVVMLFDENSSRHAREAVLHLRQQLFIDFEGLLHFQPGCAARDVQAARRAMEKDARLRILTGEVSPADWPSLPQSVILSEGGVLLREHGLYLLLTAAEASGRRCLIYADEDHLDRFGIRRRPNFKPTFSPELLRRRDYLGPCVLFRGEKLDLAALLVEGPSAVQPLAKKIALRRRPPKIVHLPFVTYHDVRDTRAEPNAQRERLPSAGTLPTVSIVIPTRDRLDILEPCLASIMERTIYPAGKYDVWIVDNGSREKETLRFLREAADSGVIRLLKDDRKFNYARLSNLGVLHASGEVLVFLNNDTLVEDPNWLKLLVAQAMKADVAAVGGKLLYPDGTVQFGGTVIGIQAVAGHAHVGLDRDDGGYRGTANVTHEVSALTGACLAVRREMFERLGRFDEALAVACNDVLLCTEALKRGYRNLYIGRPLMVHCESKSRGFDDTLEKRELFLDEAGYMRAKHRQLFRNDPYYNPNLSYERTHDIAFPPRREKPWRQHARKAGPLRILILSIVHAKGHGVPVVLQKQVEHLAMAGHKVLVGGPQVHRGIRYQGCELVRLNDPADAAAFAVAKDIDIVIAHTPPFYSVVRWLGDWPRHVLYDYGEPPIDWFDDVKERRIVRNEKRLSFALAEQVFAISDAVRAESGRDDAGVIPLGNTHLSAWDEASLARRNAKRRARGWKERVVVLNVCRFHRAERRYKGVDFYADVAERFRLRYPELEGRVEFVLCGRASAEDVREAEALGLTVIANASDAELIDLYAAADIYMNFSKWEGYNLGIGQALAFGLPVIASDIPAHREFGVMTTDDAEEAVSLLEPLIAFWQSGELLRARTPKLWDWDAPLAQFADIVERACRPE